MIKLKHTKCNASFDDSSSSSSSSSYNDNMSIFSENFNNIYNSVSETSVDPGLNSKAEKGREKPDIEDLREADNKRLKKQ